jgi:hypothetical protein
VQAVCYTNELAGVQNSCDTLFDDAGFGAAGLLTDQQSTCCLSAVTPQRAIINIGAGSVYTNEPAGVQIRNTPLMMLARFAAGLLTDQQSTCCLSAVTPQRAIINIASAVCYTMN